MKATSHVPVTQDRMTTREELGQVMELFERVPGQQEPAGTYILEYSLPLLKREGPADTRGLWIDMFEDDANARLLDAGTESLAELFCDGGDRVN